MKTNPLHSKVSRWNCIFPPSSKTTLCCMPYEMELKCWNISSFNKCNVKLCQCRELERHYEKNRASPTDSGTFHLLLLVPSSLLPASCLKFNQWHSSPSSYSGTCTDSFSSSFSSILIDSFLMSLIGIPEISYPVLAHLHFGGVVPACPVFIDQS